MKHRTIVAICIVTIVALTAVGYLAYQDQRVRQAAAAKRAEYSHQLKKKLEAETLKNEQAKVDAECKKSEQYWSTLTTAQKAGKTAPQCNLDLVE